MYGANSTLSNPISIYPLGELCKHSVQGPRLNGKKEEMAGKMYGPDRRLDLSVHQEMPILQYIPILKEGSMYSSCLSLSGNSNHVKASAVVCFCMTSYSPLPGIGYCDTSLSVRAHSSETEHISVTDFVISCELENLSQIQLSRSHVREVCVRQISCSSQRWGVEPLSRTAHTDTKIGSRELLQVCLKSMVLSESAHRPDMYTFTDLPFQNTRLLSSATPCREFYLRSRVKLKSFDLETTVNPPSAQLGPPKVDPELAFESLNCAINLDMALIILWEVRCSLRVTQLCN
ncbi:hypothetical protein DPMN_174349 [Dreissena polymorpha]|uniref:Uncharacterized protein n=1 Tax=Dreissena polymorpha TaxID=45954 RepID=A0A9D4IF24_DREPO|nr:hypothetical protein DPMN_174349 [Dreissena polymorpha]